MGLKVYLVFVALLHMKQSHQDSCMLTNICPATRELWNQRSKTFNCTERGTNYTCMLNKENLLVETCMYENVVGKEIVGCPFITTCKDSPQIAPENHYTDCPENIPGCPERNHEPYTIFEMYKYPVCFYSDKYEYAFLNKLPTATYIFNKTQSSTTDQSSATPVGLLIAITIAITMLFTLSLGIVVVLIKRCSRRKREGSNRNTEDENMTEIKDVTPNVTVEKQSTCLQPLISESPNINTENENTTELEDVTPNVAEDTPLINSHPSPLGTDKSFFGRLKGTLLQISKDAVASISFSPIQKNHKLPLELLFARVVIKTKTTLSGIVELIKDLFPDIKGPTDLFYKDGKPLRRIYMKGDAARGKTTYCLWLLQHWFHANHRTSETKELSEWVKTLGSFEFVFFIRLRDVDKSRATVIDMICYDVLNIEDKEYIEWVKSVLKNDRYHSLIIIDGLDEWRPDQDVTNSSKFEGMPLFDDIENCVIFITMRPWKYENVAHNVKTDDQTIEILGLDKAGIRSMTANVLTNHYNLDIKSTGKQIYDEMMHKIEKETLGSLMEIPLLAVVCVQIWLKGEEVGKSLTRFYIEMIGMLIERAQEKHKIDQILETSDNDEGKSSFSCRLCKHPIVSKYVPVLRKLGKLAYNWLMSGKNTFEIYSDTLVQNLGLTQLELDFSLNVGILSREEVNSTSTKTVKLYFFHKSVQEFLGAVYIADNEGIVDSFRGHLSSTNKMMELGNVLKFLSGLNSKLGSEMSHHIANITNDDAEIRELRKYHSIIPMDLKLQGTWKLQLSCYREFVYAQDSDNTQTALCYHVSDVCASPLHDEENTRATVEILCHHYADIKSLTLFDSLLGTDTNNVIPDSVLTRFLDKTKTLQSLFVQTQNAKRTFSEICDRFFSLTALHLISITLTSNAVKQLHSVLQSNRVLETLGLEYITVQVNKVKDDEPASLSGLLHLLPKLPRLFSLRIQISNKVEKPVFLDALKRLSHLKSIEYHRTLPNDHEYDSTVVHHLSKWKGLHWLWLSQINLSDNGLKLSPEMEVLETLMLDEVTMSENEWYNFVKAIDLIEHKIHVRLHEVKINDKSLLKLLHSEHEVTLH